MKPFATALIALRARLAGPGARPCPTEVATRFAVKTIHVCHFAGRLGW
jgi:hypothetical protein